MTRADKIEALRLVPSQLKAALDNITEAELSASYREGGWNVRQIVHHLADSHLNAFVRIMLMLTEDKPLLKTWEQDAWAKLPEYNDDYRLSLAIVEGIHGRMVSAFEQMRDEDWSRSGSHAERGEITIADMLDIYFDHGAHHVEQIKLARAGIRGRR